MNEPAAQHHWLNTIVGILDSAFFLTDEEQFAVAGIVQQVLRALRIPERGTPLVMPVPVSQEASNGYYSLALSGPRESGVVRAVRPATEHDVVVSIETWREAIVGLFLTAYPDINADERLLLTKTFHDLLAAIGAPQRAAAFLPDVVQEAYRAVEIRTQ